MFMAHRKNDAFRTLRPVVVKSMFRLMMSLANFAALQFGGTEIKPTVGPLILLKKQTLFKKKCGRLLEIGKAY
jgi:hypothetical protein